MALLSRCCLAHDLCSTLTESEDLARHPSIPGRSFSRFGRLTVNMTMALSHGDLAG